MSRNIAREEKPRMRESNYDFRKRYCRVHKRIIGWKDCTPTQDEWVLPRELKITSKDTGLVVQNALQDFKAL